MAEQGQRIEAVLALRDEMTKPAAKAEKAVTGMGVATAAAAKKSQIPLAGMVKSLLGVGAAMSVLDAISGKVMDGWAVKLNKMELAMFGLLRLFGIISAKDAKFITDPESVRGLDVAIKSADDTLTSFYRGWLRLSEEIQPAKRDMSEMAVVVEKLRLEMQVSAPFDELAASLRAAARMGSLTDDQLRKLLGTLDEIKQRKIESAFEIVITPSMTDSLVDLRDMWDELDASAETLPTKFQTGFASVTADVTDLGSVGGTVASTMRSAFDDVFTGLLLDGRELNDILADILRSIARVFLSFGSGIVTRELGIATGMQKAANGAVFPGHFEAFANGSPRVTRPTLGLIGEGDRPEAVVPLPDGRRIPVDMRGGGGGGPNVTIHVTAMDSQDVLRALSKPEVQRMLFGVTAKAARSDTQARRAIRGAA